MGTILNPPIGLDEFAAFITDRWGDRPCHCCGHKAWRFGETTQRQLGGLMMILEDGQFDYGRSLVSGFYLAVCGHCGDTRLITRPVLEGWVNARRANPDSNVVPGPGFSRQD